MQRLGFCKALVVEAVRVHGGRALTRFLRESVESTHWVPVDPRLAECIEGRPSRGAVKVDSSRGVEVSLQDYYICNHPSKSGWLSRDGCKEYTEGLVRYLGLLDIKYRPSDFGQVLGRGLLAGEEAEAFRSISLDVNPLSLTLGQRVQFLYLLVDKDGDFLIPFVEALSSAFGTGAFSYLDAGEVLPEVLGGLLRRFMGAGYSRAEREQLKQLRSALASIEEAIAGRFEKLGSGSRREQTTIPRMEWLIDLGLAEKAPPEGTARRYRLTDTGRAFCVGFSAAYEGYVKVKYPEEAVATLLDHDFFTLVQGLYSAEEARITCPTDIVEYLSPAYRILSGVSGYCVIRPLLLLANARYLHEGRPVVEYGDVLSAVEEAFRADPDRVYYTVTRRGSDYQLRLSS